MKNRQLPLSLSLTLLLTFITVISWAQNPSAIVEFESTDKGMLIPRLDSTAVVASPATGLLIYDLSKAAFQYYDVTAWVKIGASLWTQNGSDIFYNIGNVGIGTNTPLAKLDVNADVLVNGLTIGKGGGSGLLNTAVGQSALESNTTSYDNAAIASTRCESGI